MLNDRVFGFTIIIKHNPAWKNINIWNRFEKIYLRFYIYTIIRGRSVYVGERSFYRTFYFVQSTRTKKMFMQQYCNEICVAYFCPIDTRRSNGIALFLVTSLFSLLNLSMALQLLQKC